MEKDKIFALLMITVLLISFSCASAAKSKEPPPMIPRIGVKLSFSADMPSGTITIEPKNNNGAEILWEKTEDLSSLAGASKWIYFYTDSVSMLESGVKYRIYIKRSDEHSPQNAVYWSAETEDPYPSGVSSVKNADFDAQYFKYTNTSDEPDVETTPGNYGYFIYDDYRWQEFLLN